jgi:hypothetical protein
MADPTRNEGSAEGDRRATAIVALDADELAAVQPAARHLEALSRFVPAVLEQVAGAVDDLPFGFLLSHVFSWVLQAE